MGNAQLIHGDARDALPILNRKVDLLWTDPPFNTGDTQTLVSTGKSYDDKYDSVELYLSEMRGVFEASKRLMVDTGVVAVCLDYRSVHDMKVRVLDDVFGAESFRGEIIWHSELGGVPKKWWANKHNTVLLYAAGPDPLFRHECVPMVERKAPRGDYQSSGRKANSVWTITLSSSAGERCGYPNQKPLALITPFVNVHTPDTGTVLDPFMGSGSTVVAAVGAGRSAIGIDINPEAVLVAEQRVHDRQLTMSVW